MGVDIPECTVMVIEGANRFGLAQLHQFRGRVGRGERQSYCLLIPENEERLRTSAWPRWLKPTTDLSWPNETCSSAVRVNSSGTRQSGYSTLQMANLTDIRLIEKAREQAQAIFTG